MRRIEKRRARRVAARRQGAASSFFPHEFMYKILRSGVLEEHYQIDPKDSWLLAAAEHDLPMFVPGWEDSTLGNIFAGALHRRRHRQRPHGAHRHRVHDDARRLVPGDVPQGLDRLLPDRRRHRRRLPDLRRADAAAGPAAAGHAALGLLLPDQRLDDELRLVLGRRAEREDHLGQASASTRRSSSSSPTRRSSRR